MDDGSRDEEQNGCLLTIWNSFRISNKMVALPGYVVSEKAVSRQDSIADPEQGADTVIF